MAYSRLNKANQVRLEYGNDMATPSLPNNKIAPWKRGAFISFFGGLGIALALGLIFGVAYWFNTRPKPWKNEAIKAHLVHTTWYPSFNDSYLKEPSKHRSGELAENDSQQPLKLPKRFVRFLGTMWVQVLFDLENTTAYDYTLQAPTDYGLVRMQKLKSSNGLVTGNLIIWSAEQGGNFSAIGGDNSILIPARQTVRVRFSNQYSISEDDDPNRRRDWGNNEVQKQFVREMLRDIDSFVILDETSRYRIELPLQDAVKD
jgi:hypothetical protein